MFFAGKPCDAGSVSPTSAAELAFGRLERLLAESGARFRPHLRPINFTVIDAALSVWSFDPARPGEMIAPIEHPRPAGILSLTSRTLQDLLFSRELHAGDPISFQGDISALRGLFQCLQTGRSPIGVRISRGDR